MDNFFLLRFRVIQRVNTKLFEMVVVQETNMASICFMLKSNKIISHFERKIAKLTDVLHYFMYK
jgi:hypothetical protein